ncbi:Uncharacterized protein OBRU01_20446, partial [Operophtera brumata]
APAHVTITGPSEARVGDPVPLACSTAPSNPAAEIKWACCATASINSSQRTSCPLTPSTFYSICIKSATPLGVITAAILINEPDNMTLGCYDYVGKTTKCSEKPAHGEGIKGYAKRAAEQ